MTTQPNTPEQPKREDVEGLNAELNFFAEAMFEAGMASGAKVSDAYSRSDACKQDAETIRRNIHSLVSAALSTQAAELERAVVDKEAMQEERNDAQSMLDDTRKELDRVKKQLEDRTADWEYVRKQKDEVVALRDREKAELAAAMEAIRNGWAIDTEDGIFCQYCSAEVELSDKDYEAGKTAQECMRGEVNYACFHSAQCVTALLK